MTLKKKFYVSLFSLIGVVIFIAVAAVITWNVMTISYDSDERIESLDSTITITRDENGIPRIEASSLNDMYFALGYIHAKDRLDLVELNRALANGNSSDFIDDENDSKLLDAVARTIGFTLKAEEIIAVLTPEQRACLNRYCDGINFIRKNRPASYLLQRDWTPTDVLAVLVMKEWSNSYLNNLELVMNMPENRKSSLKNPLPGKKYIHYYRDEESPTLQTLRKIKTVIEKYSGTFNRGFSAYIDSTLDITTNNYYTTFMYYDCYSTYPGWYPVKILINHSTIDAITFSGLPFLFAFKNSVLSMIHYNMNADSQEFILFDTEEHDGRIQYRMKGTWHDFKTLRVPVKAADGSDANEIVWITDKGPVINETGNPGVNGNILVISSQFPGYGYVDLLFDAPFAAGPAALKKSISDADAPLKCYLVASDKETFKAYSGYICSKPDENVFKDNRSLTPDSFTRINLFKTGLAIDYICSDSISFNELSGHKELLITDDFKSERIRQLLVPRRIFNEEKINEIITDKKSVAAEKFTPVFRSILETNPLTSARLTKIYLNEWDYNVSYQSQSSAIFYTTLYYYIMNTLENEFGPDSPYNMRSAYLIFSDFFNMLSLADQSIFDNPETENTENREMIFDTAFFNAMRFLNRKTGPLMEEWTWSRTNSAKFTVPKLKYNMLSYIFRVKNIPVDGGPDTIASIIFDNYFAPVSGESLAGYMNSSLFKFSMKAGYSTSLVSHFYYGKKPKIDLIEIGNIQSMYKSVLYK